jgi:hypothetical protein
MATVIIKHELKDEELWGAMWGSGFESDPVTNNYLMSMEFIEGDWDKVGVVEVYYVSEDDDDEGTVEENWLMKRLNMEDVTNALTLAMAEGYRHVPCGGNIDTNIDDWDACVGDILLQLALYGKEVWA